MHVTYTYNENGQVLTEKSNLGTLTYHYEKGMLTSLTDQKGNIYAFVYDANGNVIQYTDADGIVTDYKVDVSGRVLSEAVELKDGQKAVTIYTYDVYGNILSKMDPLGNTTTYSYDANGNLEKIKDALGNSTDFGYNEYRKIVKQKDANGNVTTYDYDSSLNCVRVTDAEQGITEFAYDGIGQIIAMTKKGDKEDVTLSMTYDPLGNVTSITDGEGNVRRMHLEVQRP